MAKRSSGKSTSARTSQLRSTRQKARPLIRLDQVCEILGHLAPLHLAQSWDNVGLLAGDPTAGVRRAILCIDLTPDVLAEAIKRKADLIVAYHPPLFKPVARLSATSRDTDSLLFRCIAAGIAIYSTHTALDAAEGGTNDVLAEMCNLVDSEPFEYVEGAGGEACKIVVFVPINDADLVAEAMFRAGAGDIGDYARCSFRIPGTGTFHGGAATNPVLGIAGRYETVEEVRVEVVVPRGGVSEVVDALCDAHPYEVPAYDIYPLHRRPVRGIGRWGPLRKEVSLMGLARRLKRATHSAGCSIVGSGSETIGRVALCVGSAGSLPFRLPLVKGDCIVTGEMRHHDALTILRRGLTAIVVGHWTSERPMLHSFSGRLSDEIPGLDVLVSKADCEPFVPVK